MNSLLLFMLLFGAICNTLALKEGECEVCIATVNRFIDSLDKTVKKDTAKIEIEFKKFCKDTRSKEKGFCYYMGGLEESATGTLRELSEPISWFMPADKICERLKKKNAHLCDLRYDKQIDLDNVNLKELKVRQLKKILSDWEESCDGCIEKSEFIARIEELKPKYVSRAKTEL